MNAIYDLSYVIDTARTPVILVGRLESASFGGHVVNGIVPIVKRSACWPQQVKSVQIAVPMDDVAPLKYTGKGRTPEWVFRP